MSNSSASAACQPTLSPTAWAGEPQACPAWVGFPSLTEFPAGLLWSGRGEVPAIGDRVHIYLNGFGAAEVKAYFHAEGFLGVVCAPEVLPAWFQRQCPGVTLGHCFGRELEPYQPAPALVVGSPDDWIPDYPPQDE
ncbi:hypothetical protein [Hymenobacter pini]|uniref:hypothetical protein n=1 Tax=Hymenobacter pini TaxID=2880879 RepID=UPI001CF529A5|nr:hypothetical protein [Hymenobacter pini]MCA8833295.1 hypothetical protein [Hymenobacter pini]